MAAAAFCVTWVGASGLRSVDSLAPHALEKVFHAESRLFLRLASCRMPSLRKADSQACNTAKHCLRYLSSKQSRFIWLSPSQFSVSCLAGSRQAGYCGFFDRAATSQEGRKCLKGEIHQFSIG